VNKNNNEGKIIVEKVKYSDSFYTNVNSEEYVQLIHKYIELVTNNPSNRLKEWLSELEEYNVGQPVWQAAIVGEAKLRLFSKSSVGVFLINNQYIVYFYNEISNIDEQYNKPNLGFSAVSNNITTQIVDSDQGRKIQIDTSFEKVFVGVSSSSIDKDFKIIKQLLSDNNKNFNSLLKKKQEDYNKNSFTMTNKRSGIENVDSRFKTNNYIISSNYIPDGFVFKSPVIYASRAPYSLKNFTAPNEGYIKAYNESIEEIKKEIDNGKYDAVFNLSFKTHNVEGNYEIVLIGDATLIDD